ncbi:zinc finger protein 3-like [Cyprinodon tularosa]|uniref:zinc finger protein 3-like n=1 Tax=Cyprinodon tularosa TaxID=77115 RepID=UPI0018E27D48|nr:zinc finger protein 3-like [Cyprinodon tularosa]
MLHLRVFLNERLNAVAEEILGAVEKTIIVYQEELLRSKDSEIQQLKMQLKLQKSVDPDSEQYLETEQLHSPPPPSASPSPSGSPSVQPHQSSPAMAAPHEEEHPQGEEEEEEDELDCADQEHPETSQVKDEQEEATKRHFWMVHDPTENQEDPEPHVQEFISPHTGMLTSIHDQALHFQQQFASSNNNGGGGSSSGEESRDRPYICSVCEKRFSNCSHLAAHIRTHTGERPYMCDICRKTFITTSALNRHQTIHTEGKRYICAFCGKSFKWMESLGRHVRSVHKRENIQE